MELQRENFLLKKDFLIILAYERERSRELCSLNYKQRLKKIEDAISLLAQERLGSKRYAIASRCPEGAIAQ